MGRGLGVGGVQLLARLWMHVRGQWYSCREHACLRMGLGLGMRLGGGVGAGAEGQGLGLGLGQKLRARLHGELRRSCSLGPAAE